MNKNRVVYPIQSLLVSSSPFSGYNFLNISGALNDDYNNLETNYNLLKQINRVQSLSYGISTEKTNIKNLGKKGFVARENVNPATVNLNFDYLLNGVVNEIRLGLNCNFSQLEYHLSGQPYYSSSVCPVSGLENRNLIRQNNSFNWPYTYTDKRNIFVVIGVEGENLLLPIQTFDVPDTSQPTNERVNEFEIIGFGNCFLSSYSTSCSIGQLPRASVSFACENVIFETSGSGLLTPGVDSHMSGFDKHVVIPELREESSTSVLRPTLIELNINSPTLNLSNQHIQGYSIDFTLDREPLDSLGHKLPIDRQINFPVLVNLSFEMIVNDIDTGNLVEILKQNIDNNITIQLKNPECSEDFALPENPHHGGLPPNPNMVAIRYDFSGAKLEGFSFNSSIGANKIATFDFITEMDTADLSKGFFISGLLNIDKIEDYIIEADGTYLLNEDGTPIVWGYPPLF